MKRLSLIFIIFALPLIAYTQTVKLKVNGIEVGTSYSTVIKKLGKPLSIKKGTYPCEEGAKVIVTKYKGLSLAFLESYPAKKLFVAKAEVTSPQWNIPRVRLGESVKQIRSKFSIVKERTTPGFDVYTTINGEGYAYFYFKKNKLVKVSWELNAC